MSKTTTGAFALALLASIGVAAIVLTPALSADSANWQVVVANHAFVSHGLSGKFKPAAMGDVIRTGDRLTTRDGGTLVLSRGQDMITLSENTQIAIVDPQPANATLIEEPYGEAEYRVEHRAAPHFEVDTPLLATVVKGTTFSVQSNATSSAVSVKKGRVTAVDRRSGASSSVGSGETGSVASRGISVSVDKAPASAAAAPAAASAPAQSSPAGPSAPKGPEPKGPSGPKSGPGAPAGPAGDKAKDGPAGPAGGGAPGGPAGGGKSSGGKGGPGGPGGPAGGKGGPGGGGHGGGKGKH